MSSVREWVDDCVSKEIRNVPHKPKGAVNIIVYDNTNVPPAGAYTVGDRVRSAFNTHESLTFWWKLGSLIDQVRGFADYSVPAATWDEAFRGIKEAVAAEADKTGEPATIASLQFWGHGSPGAAYMGSASGGVLRASTLNTGGQFHTAAREVAGLMHPKEGHVWFRCCMPFQGASGQAFATAAASAFQAPVVGHTFTIHALQSGTRVLQPGQRPDWDEDEGIHKRGKRKGQDVLSGPLSRGR